jgi:hypothetical protein
MANDEWEPLLATMSFTNINGFSLVSKKTREEAVLIAETISILDKRKIGLRSPIQVFQNFYFIKNIF